MFIVKRIMKNGANFIGFHSEGTRTGFLSAAEGNNYSATLMPCRQSDMPKGGWWRSLDVSEMRADLYLASVYGGDIWSEVG